MTNKRGWSRRTVLKASLAGIAAPAVAGLVRQVPGIEAAPSLQAAPTHVLPVWKKGIDAGVIDLSSPLTYDIDGDGKQEIIGATTYWDDSKTGAARDTQKPRIYILRANGDVYQMIDIQGGGTVESSVASTPLWAPGRSLPAGRRRR